MTSGHTRRAQPAHRPEASARGRPRALRERRARIRVLVADSYPIDRRGLVGLLRTQRDLEVVGEVGTATEAIAACKELAPDVVVLAQNVPFEQGETAVGVVRAAVPGARILALADRSPEHCVVLHPPSRVVLDEWAPGRGCGTGTDCLQLALKDGAIGTLRRSAAPEQLFQAVRAVASGNAWLEPGTAGHLAASANDPGAVQPLEMSGRELNVAAMIAEGLSNKEISTALRISEPTVKKYVGRILTKLGVVDRLQAGLFLARHPLLLRRRSDVER